MREKRQVCSDSEGPYNMPNSLVYSKQLGPRGYQKDAKHVSGLGSVMGGSCDKKSEEVNKLVQGVKLAVFLTIWGRNKKKLELVELQR